MTTFSPSVYLSLALALALPLSSPPPSCASGHHRHRSHHYHHLHHHAFGDREIAQQPQAASHIGPASTPTRQWRPLDLPCRHSPSSPPSCARQRCRRHWCACKPRLVHHANASGERVCVGTATLDLPRVLLRLLVSNRANDSAVAQATSFHLTWDVPSACPVALLPLTSLRPRAPKSHGRRLRAPLRLGYLRQTTL